MAKIGELLVSIVGDNSSLTKALNDSDKQVTNFGASMATALAGVVSFAAIAAAAVKGIEFNKAAEQAQVSFEVMTGSAQLAAETLKDLKDFANSTPLEFKDIRDATQTMLAFGINAKDATKYIKQLGDVSGGNADKLKSLSLAFSQIQSTGRLMGQDLLQLVNAGFNPLNEISRTTGESMADLKKKMEDGAISFEMVANAFDTATSAGGRFDGMLAKQAETLGGAQSTFNDAFDTFLGGTFEGMTKPLVEMFKALSAGLAKVGDNFKPIGDMLGGFVVIATKAFELLFNIIDALPGPVVAFAVALGVVKLAMISISAAAVPMGLSISAALGPIGIAITAITVGVGLLVGEINNIETKRINDLATELGVTADEAKRLSEISKNLGIEVKQVQEEFSNLDAEKMGSLVDRSIDLLMLSENLEETIHTIASEYEMSASQVTKVLQAQDMLGQRSKEEIDDLITKFKLQEKLYQLTLRGDEIGAKMAKGTHEADMKFLDEIREADKKAAIAKKKTDEENAEKSRLAREKAYADEMANRRNDLENLLKTEEEKLIAEKKRLKSVAKTKEENDELDRIYSEKFLALKQKEFDAVNALKQKELNDNLKLFNEQHEGDKILSKEMLDRYKKEVEAAEITLEEKKRLLKEADKAYEDSVKNQTETTMDYVNNIVGAVNDIASAIQGIWDANLRTRLDQIEAEKQAALEAAGFGEQTEMERLVAERDAAIQAGDDVLAAQKAQEIKRQKILDDAAKAAAQAEYEAAMNAYTLQQTMAVVNAAAAIINAWTTGGWEENLVETVAIAAVTVGEIATIAANRPQPPALFTGTTNPLKEAGVNIVGDQGAELVLPKGSTVLNNRDTLNALGGGGGSMRSQIMIYLNGQMIGDTVADLINNGQVRIEAFA